MLLPLINETFKTGFHKHILLQVKGNHDIVVPIYDSIDNSLDFRS